jgi:hypothetical protein
MNGVFPISQNLEMVVLNSLTFGKRDEELRWLVSEYGYQLQLQVLKEQGSDNPAADALSPIDTIGSNRVPGILTDRNDPSPEYHYLNLMEKRPSGNKLIGIYITEQRIVPELGEIITEWFSPLVPKKFAKNEYVINGSAKRPYDILWNFSKQFTKDIHAFAARITDGKGIPKSKLAEQGFVKIGPSDKNILWVPPLNANTIEQYRMKRPIDLYILFHNPEISVPYEAVRWLCKDYLQANTEMNDKVRDKLGYTLSRLPAYRSTMRRISTIASANENRIPCSPIEFQK